MVSGAIVTMGTDAVLHAMGIFPPLGQPVGDAPLLLATAYRTVYSAAASYLIARLAPDRPMQHALAGGVLGLVLSTGGAVVTWNKVGEFGPHWYPLALVVLSLPTAWAGAQLWILQSRALRPL
jgi:hypothetical protein